MRAFVLGSKHAETDIAGGESHEDGQEDKDLSWSVGVKLVSNTTYHALVTDWLNEIVENLGECLCTDSGSPNGHWIPLHADKPVLTHRRQCWCTTVVTTTVCSVLVRTLSHLRQHGIPGLFTFLVHVALDCTPEAICKVDQPSNH